MEIAKEAQGHFLKGLRSIEKGLHQGIANLFLICIKVGCFLSMAYQFVDIIVDWDLEKKDKKLKTKI